MPRPSFRIGGLVLYEDEIARVWLGPTSPFDSGVKIILKSTYSRIYKGIVVPEPDVIELGPGKESDAFRFYWDNMAPQAGCFDVLRFYDNKEQILKLLEKQKAEAQAAVQNRMNQAEQNPPPLPNKFRPVKKADLSLVNRKDPDANGPSEGN